MLWLFSVLLWFHIMFFYHVLLLLHNLVEQLSCISPHMLCNHVANKNSWITNLIVLLANMQHTRVCLLSLRLSHVYTNNLPLFESSWLAYMPVATRDELSALLSNCALLHLCVINFLGMFWQIDSVFAPVWKRLVALLTITTASIFNQFNSFQFNSIVKPLFVPWGQFNAGHKTVATTEQ